MKTIKILMITAMLLALSSCCVPQKVFFRSYVRDYYSAENIVLELRVSRKGNQVIVIKPAPDGHWFDPPYMCGYGSNGIEKDLYDVLCHKHNDISYNRTVVVDRNEGSINNRYNYIGTDFVSIKVVSDSDFDERHPKGSDLGDIIRYAGYSPKKYFDSGYKDEFDWSTAGGLAGEFYAHTPTDITDYPNQFEHPIDKLVSELTPSDLMLLGIYNMGAMQFEVQPTMSKTHHLTVTMTTDRRKPLSASIEMTF